MGWREYATGQEFSVDRKPGKVKNVEGDEEDEKEERRRKTVRGREEKILTGMGWWVERWCLCPMADGAITSKSGFRSRRVQRTSVNLDDDSSTTRPGLPFFSLLSTCKTAPLDAN
jgi:hypothetical protein